MVTTGVDIVQVKRISRLLRTQRKRFLERVFTPNEITYCESKITKPQHYAARFAAKEAFLKAVPPTLAPASYKDIEVHKEGNVPVIRLARAIRKRFSSLVSIALSIAHEKDFAVAVVVVEWKKKRA